MAQQQQRPGQQQAQQPSDRQQPSGTGGRYGSRGTQFGQTQQPSGPTQQQFGSTGQTGTPQQMGQYGGQQQRFGGQQPGGQQVGGQQSVGQQVGGQQPGGQQISGQQVGGMTVQFEDALTGEMRQALSDFSKVDKACEWAVDRTLGQGIPDAARVLRDVADLAELNEKLIARSSVVGPHVAETFVKVANEALQDLNQYDQPHIVEATKVIRRAVDSTNKLLSSIGWSGGTAGISAAMTTGTSGGGQQQTYY